MNEEQNKFTYHYKASTERERKTAERIRAGYLPKQEKASTAKGERMRAALPTVVSLSLGIVGTLLFGGGLALILEAGKLLLGSGLCVLGLVPVVAAYPAYIALFKKREEKKTLTKY